MKWNESGFRPPLCTYRLNWARRTSWGWWDDWDDTVLQTQDSKFEPWRSEAEHATSRSRRLPTILTFTRGWGRNIFVSFKPPRPGTEPRTLAWKAAVLTTTLGPPPWRWMVNLVNGPLLCSLMHVCLLYTMMMGVKGVVEKWIEYESRRNAISATWKRFFFGLRIRQQPWRWQFGSLCWKSPPSFSHWPHR